MRRYEVLAMAAGYWLIFRDEGDSVWQFQAGTHSQDRAHVQLIADSLNAHAGRA
jgi:hypothetical protein